MCKKKIVHFFFLSVYNTNTKSKGKKKKTIWKKKTQKKQLFSLKKLMKMAVSNINQINVQYQGEIMKEDI